ncbi:uncharacterized protein LOC143923218 [Arctopsyche grandis]|uniref:uncharacterized protein LOC143923218 n=1 Tax=Arctopsyche grandis TaxID=121162 RepID=UPI00406DA26F
MNLDHEMILEQCPVCAVNGKTSNLKFFHINYDEKVLLCKDKQCPFPYGYEEFKYMKNGSQLTNHEKSERVHISVDSTKVCNIEKKSEELHSPKNITMQLCQNQIKMGNLPQKEKLNISNKDNVTKLYDASDGHNVNNFESLEDISLLKINNPPIPIVESEINREIVLKNKLPRSGKIAKALNFISCTSKLHQATRKIDNKAAKPVAALLSPKTNKTCSLNKVSRFPKFSFAMDNMDDLKSSNKIDSSNNEILQKEKELNNIDGHDNISPNDFINEFIDNICSQPVNVDKEIEICDDFLQDVIGV